METKKEIRETILQLRDGMEDYQWQVATETITQSVISHDYFRECTDLYCYVNIRKEVETKAIIQEAWKLGKRVWVPKVHGESMEFYEIHSFDELTPGNFHVPEPAAGTPADGKDGLVIMPGVAFDVSRHRIGYGKGYYDKYLSSHPHLRTIAIAFEIQMLENVPHSEYDIKPEVLITESEIFEGGTDASY